MISQDTTNHNPDTFFMDFLTHETLLDSSAGVRKSGLKRESVFEEHSLQVTDPEMPIIENKPDFQAPAWILSVFIIQFLMIGIVLTFFRNLFRLQISSAFSQSNQEQLIREGNPIKQTYTALLLLVFGLTLSVFAFISIKLNVPGIKINDFELFFYLFAFILGIPLVKVILFSIIGFASRERQVNTIYTSNLIVFDVLIGLILFPIVFFYTYRQIEEIFYLAIAISTLLFIIRGIRGVQLVLKNSSFPSLYIILYLCTLEIAPVLLIVISILRITGYLA
ncbi:MAG: DUF4271 domain-containing protein [Bacteroidales bacterium]|nr:DUF4271 domain-containing protein [Bacteroidales bacterium]MCF8327226.1 DUF4271 domain-containing protein [Bacteroidales bacterium]